jgi:hypothetical protein
MKLFISATIIILIGAVFIWFSYYTYEKLRTKYHESVPEALGITGAILVGLGIIGHFRRRAYKEGNFWGWFVLRDLTNAFFNFF